MERLKETYRDEIERKTQQFEEDKQRLIDRLQKTDIWKVAGNMDVDTRDMENLIRLSVEVREMQNVLNRIDFIEKNKKN